MIAQVTEGSIFLSGLQADSPACSPLSRIVTRPTRPKVVASGCVDGRLVAEGGATVDVDGVGDAAGAAHLVQQ